MLLFTRNNHHPSVYLGRKDIIFTLIKINHTLNQVQFGIDAPSNIKIYREEIYDKYTVNNPPARIGVFNKSYSLSFSECPYCYNKELICLEEALIFNKGRCYFVKCDNCSYQTNHYKSIEEAIQEWDYLEREQEKAYV